MKLLRAFQAGVAGSRLRALLVVAGVAIAIFVGLLVPETARAKPPAPVPTPDAKPADPSPGQTPADPVTGDMRFLSANAAFDQARYDDARRDYEEYLQDDAGGPHGEECYYRLALCTLFAGNADEACKQVDDYLRRYPGGAFVTDAKYRRAQCLYAAQKNEEAAAACREWLRQYPQGQGRADVLSLLGDAQVAAGQSDEALDAYTQAYRSATDDGGLRHAIREAAKILQKRGDWPALRAMSEAFVREHPGHPLEATALLWIAQADTKTGKTDEAKRFLAGNIARFLNDPQREGVEGLLDQLATLCASRNPSGPASAADASPPSSAAPAADPGAELAALLGDAAKDRNPAARARLLYAKAQVACLCRNDEEAERDLLEIGTTFQPDDLSAVLLGRAGDALLAAGRTDEAALLFQRLLERFPRSDAAVFGFRGLGEVALRKHQYDDALKLFSDGLDQDDTALELKDLTLGKANALLGLGRYDDAKKIFEQVAASREWRGEATAASVYALGEIEARQGHWAEANAYYQRVYVAYQHFLPWVAKAYLGSAASLEKLGKKQDAINTYRDMLRNRKLSTLPETTEARRRLQALGAG